MRTRRSKLGDEGEPEEKLGSTEDDDKTMSVDVILEESPAGVESEVGASTTCTKQDGSEADEMEESALNSDEVEARIFRILDSDKMEEGVCSDEVEERIFNILDSDKIEDVLNSDEVQMEESVPDSDKTEKEVLNSDKVEKVAPEDGAGGSSSSVTENKISDTVKTPVGGVDHSKSTTVDETCISWKIEKDVLEILHKKANDRTADEKKLLRKDLSVKTAQARVFGRKFCEEKKITFPNHKTFHIMSFDLYTKEKLDEENLKMALEKAANGQPLGDKEGLSSKEKDDLSAQLMTVSPNERLEPGLFKMLCDKYRELTKTYCESKNIPIPSRKRFFRIMKLLRGKKELNEEQFKICLDEHGEVISSKKDASHWNSQRNHELFVKNPDAGEGDLLPSVVKPMNEMTDEERSAFFKEFSALRKELKPIAIKHCHAIKAPFPNNKVFYSICRDLFEVGMLDEENIKISVEMAFEEMINMGGPVTDAELSLIVKHYIQNKGIKNMSVKTMKKEFLHQIPKHLITKKNYWSLLYKERKINLFTDKSLASPRFIKDDSAKKPELSSDASVVKNTSVTSSGEPAEPKSNETSLPKPQTVEEPKIPRKRVRTRRSRAKAREDWSARWSEKKLKDLHDMDLPLSSNTSQLTGNSQDRLAQKSKQSLSQGADGSKLTVNNQKSFPQKPAQLSSRGVASKVNSQNLPALMDQKLLKLPALMGPPNGGTRNANTGYRFAEKASDAWNGRATASAKDRSGLNLPSASSSGGPRYTNSRDMSAPHLSYASSRGAKRDATSLRDSVSSLKKYSQVPDEEPLQQLLTQTHRLISKNEQLMGGLQNQGSSVSQSRSWQRENADQPHLSRRQTAKLMSYENNQESHLQRQPLLKLSRGAYLDAGQPSLSSQLTPGYSSPAQNLTSANFTSHSNYGVQGSYSESRGHNRAETSRDDYSWRSGYDEKSRNQGNVSGRRSQGYDYGEFDPMEGTSEQRWLQRDRFSPPRSNSNDLRDYLGRKKNDKYYRGQVDTPAAPPPPVISSLTEVSTSRSRQELLRKKGDDDWRYARHEVPQKKSLMDDDGDRFGRREPPQKKSRLDEDIPSRSVDLQREMNEFDNWMAVNTKRSAEPLMNQDTSSRSWARASPPKDLPRQSNKEEPPVFKRGQICKVGIVHEDYPRMKVTGEEAQLIRGTLLERIGLQSGVGPRFSDTYEEQGAVVFECEDHLTVSWLWVNVYTIEPWRNARLRPISLNKDPNEVSIRVPKMLQNLTPQALCDRLMSQNPGLNTNDWKLKSSNVTLSRDVELIFYIDDTSLDALKSLGLKPYLGFTRVTVRIIHE